MGSRLEWFADWAEVARQAQYRVGEMARLTGVCRQVLHAYFTGGFGQTPRAWLQAQTFQQDLANSPLVGQITFRSNSVTRMTTTKTYDYLNRLTRIQSADVQVSQPSTRSTISLTAPISAPASLWRTVRSGFTLTTPWAR